jgi:hypothetical protein
MFLLCHFVIVTKVSRAWLVWKGIILCDINFQRRAYAVTVSWLHASYFTINTNPSIIVEFLFCVGWHIFSWYEAFWCDSACMQIYLHRSYNTHWIFTEAITHIGSLFHNSILHCKRAFYPLDVSGRASRGTAYQCNHSDDCCTVYL